MITAEVRGASRLQYDGTEHGLQNMVHGMTLLHHARGVFVFWGEI